MGIFDRNGDGKTTIGEAAYTLEQIEEYEKAWRGAPEDEDGISCGGCAMLCVGCLVSPIILFALFYVLVMIFSA